MRVLVTIPHYVGSGETSADGRTYGALAADPEPRRQAFTACLTALHQLYGTLRCFIHPDQGTARVAEAAEPHSVDVVVCTTRGRHLLGRLDVAPRYYTHHATDAEPLLLGFACHAALLARLGDYDYYGYMEDDLVMHDPWFFRKLAWFTRQVGDDKLLQPNRFEAGLNYLVSKVYLDGELNPAETAAYQDVGDSPAITAAVLGARVLLQRTLNPHSGCFFLNARQMAHWAGQPHFADHAARFIGPLETAASLGIMRTFKIYRPAPVNADFLEVQHAGVGYLEQLRPVREGSA
jgi:hypothetical protein